MHPIRNRIWLAVFLLMLFIIGIGFAQERVERNFDCFSILVGKKASTDGAVLFAHNEDDYGMQLVNYYKVPRLKHHQGDFITAKNGARIANVEETYSYLWLEMPGMEVSDSYMNEWGVTIASDACRSREKNGELTQGGITFWLRRLVAERARTARQGVKIAAELIEKYGYASSGRTYAIADPNEAWMLAVVMGKHWVAQRVPDDHVAVIPNYYTIGEINLSDTTHFLGSPDIIEYAIEQGWYHPDRDGKFHFARVYSNPENLSNPGNVHRMWRGVNLIAGKNYAIDDEFPFSLKPSKKISIEDLMRVLRDHYEGTPLDHSEHYKLGNPYEMNRSTICASSTQYGFVAQLRSWMPTEVGSVVWIAPYRPDSQAFIPWYSGITKIPGGFAYGDFESALKQHFDPPQWIYEQRDDHAFWAYVKLAQWVDEDYGKRIVAVREKWDHLEKKLFQKQSAFEKKMLKMYKKNPDMAKQAVTEYTTKWAEKTREMAKKLKGSK